MAALAAAARSGLKPNTHPVELCGEVLLQELHRTAGIGFKSRNPARDIRQVRPHERRPDRSSPVPTRNPAALGTLTTEHAPSLGPRYRV
ncbi:hypothetical protein GCM10009693_14800 [Leucobacter chromiireducens subsp. chromiireducens]